MPISKYGNGIFYDGSFTSGTSITMCYSKDGVVAFYMPYEFSIVTESEMQSVLNIEAAIDLIDKKYNSVILEGNYLIYGIDFEYVPMPIKNKGNLFTLVPAWRFNVEHTYMLDAKTDGGSPVDFTEKSSIVFNAVSGDEIPCDWGGI